MDMEVTRTAIRLFGLEIHWYGVLIVAGIGLGVWLAWKREGRMGLPRETVLDLALMLPIALMVVLAKPLYIGLIPAIAMAAYTTWKITIASIHICRRRRFGEDLLLGELITVNFIDALVSILSLQNTLIMVNQAKTGDSGSMLTLSAVSSAVIYAAIIALTAQLLRKAVKGLRMS